MTPPVSPKKGSSAAGDVEPAVYSRVRILKKRSDFQRLARAKRVSMPGFILQMRRRESKGPSHVRVGFTCSKKVGNAVTRNRAKRRLREVARLHLPQASQHGCDYVLIGRRDKTISLPFTTLETDFKRALWILHGANR